jgi:cob(I)alamin adenosyltransferase
LGARSSTSSRRGCIESGTVSGGGGALGAGVHEIGVAVGLPAPGLLPGGGETAALLHVARTVCRRAERDALTADRERGVNPLALVYLNRLSDLLFILARAANAAEGRDEPLWKPGG